MTEAVAPEGGGENAVIIDATFLNGSHGLETGDEIGRLTINAGV